MELCGTPNRRPTEVEENSLILTQNFLSERYGLKNLKTDHVIPSNWSSLEMRILRSIVSKVDVRSNKARSTNPLL